MPYLLDAHTFLWFISGDEKLPTQIKTIVLNVNQPCYISIASFWEIAIKKQIGKLKIELKIEELFSFANRNQIEIIQINEKHLITLLEMDVIHKDPFDRIIVSQAISENMTLISKDGALGGYPINLIWS